jgi:hypothetical protein
VERDGRAPLGDTNMTTLHFPVASTAPPLPIFRWSAKTTEPAPSMMVPAVPTPAALLLELLQTEPVYWTLAGQAQSRGTAILRTAQRLFFEAASVKLNSLADCAAAAEYLKKIALLDMSRRRKLNSYQIRTIAMNLNKRLIALAKKGVR